MIIKKIMCSGPKENNRPQELIDFVLTNEKAELGLCFTRNKCAEGGPRYKWMKELAEALGEKDMTATLQIGHEWCEDFCNGQVAEEVQEMLEFRGKSGKKTFNQVQLNFFINQHRVEQDQLVEMMKHYPEHRFILSYNSINKDFVESLTMKGVPFDILYSPYSEHENLSKNKDFFLGRMQGYSGGFTPDNTVSQLEKIAPTVYPGTSIYIDSHQGLRNENNEFSLDRAKEFVKNINQWVKDYSQKKNSFGL